MGEETECCERRVTRLTSHMELVKLTCNDIYRNLDFTDSTDSQPCQFSARSSLEGRCRVSSLGHLWQDCVDASGSPAAEMFH